MFEQTHILFPFSYWSKQDVLLGFFCTYLLPTLPTFCAAKSPRSSQLLCPTIQHMVWWAGDLMHAVLARHPYT